MRRRWDTAHRNLRRLYDERIDPTGMKQKEFAKRIGIAQSMLAMILSGDRPLPLDLAPAFAKELHCTIYDICPEMADYIKTELVPLLGKALRRAAMVLLSIVLYQFAPSDAYASSVLHNATHTHFCAHCVDLIHIVRFWLERLRRWMCVYAPSQMEYTQ